MIEIKKNQKKRKKQIIFTFLTIFANFWLLFHYFLTLCNKNFLTRYFLAKTDYSVVFVVATRESELRIEKFLYPPWRIQDRGQKS